MKNKGVFTYWEQKGFGYLYDIGEVDNVSMLKERVFNQELVFLDKHELRNVMFLVTIVQSVTQRRPFDLRTLNISVNFNKDTGIIAFRKLLDQHIKVIGGKVSAIKKQNGDFGLDVKGTWGSVPAVSIAITKNKSGRCVDYIVSLDSKIIVECRRSDYAT